MSARNEKWIISLINGLDKNLDEEQKKNVMEQCGRQCQSQGFINKAKDLYLKSKNLDDFLHRLALINKHIHVENDGLFMVYPKCYCPRVSKIPRGKLSKTYCYCSIGWTKALFEGALVRPVKVDLEKSIVNGDKECIFRITL